LKPIDTLLFDLDGTLIDSRLDLANAVNHAARTIGKPEHTEAEITPHVGNGLRVLLAGVLGETGESDLDRAVSAFSSFYDAHCMDWTELYPGVADFLASWRNRKKIAVVTNKPERFAVKIVKQLGLGDDIAVVVGGDTLPERKPHPAPVLTALARLQAGAAGALMIGDGVPDMLAGQSAGVRTCLAQYGFGFHPQSLDLEPDFMIRRFTELKEIVL
jgi:phosphoglycolate phosphatase